MTTIRINASALHEAILRSNLSKAAFARQVGSSAPYLVKLCRGEHKPGPRIRRALLGFTGLPFDRLFTISHVGDVDSKPAGIDRQ